MRRRSGYDGTFTPCKPYRATVDGMRGFIVGNHPLNYAIFAVRNPFQGTDGPTTTFTTAPWDRVNA